MKAVRFVAEVVTSCVIGVLFWIGVGSLTRIGQRLTDELLFDKKQNQFDEEMAEG